MKLEKCDECGNQKNLKRGWTNNLYCSENCERSSVSSLLASGPGGAPYPGWTQYDTSREIADRWEVGNE